MCPARRGISRSTAGTPKRFELFPTATRCEAAAAGRGDTAALRGRLKPATELRQKVAHGVSRGENAPRISPGMGGRFLSPRWGLSQKNKLWQPDRKAAVNAPQSKRFAQFDGIRNSRSVWIAVSLAPLFGNGLRLGLLHCFNAATAERRMLGVLAEVGFPMPAAFAFLTATR